MAQPKMSASDFAKKIKAKYPQYASFSDEELARKIVDKYPQYAESVDFGTAEVKKKVSGEPSVASESGTPSTLPPTLADTRPSVAPVRDQVAAVSNISQQQVQDKADQRKVNFESSGSISQPAAAGTPFTSLRPETVAAFTQYAEKNKGRKFTEEEVVETEQAVKNSFDLIDKELRDVRREPFRAERVKKFQQTFDNIPLVGLPAQVGIGLIRPYLSDDLKEMADDARTAYRRNIGLDAESDNSSWLDDFRDGRYENGAKKLGLDVADAVGMSAAIAATGTPQGALLEAPAVSGTVASMVARNIQSNVAANPIGAVSMAAQGALDKAEELEDNVYLSPAEKQAAVFSAGMTSMLTESLFSSGDKIIEPYKGMAEQTFKSTIKDWAKAAGKSGAEESLESNIEIAGNALVDAAIYGRLPEVKADDMIMATITSFIAPQLNIAQSYTPSALSTGLKAMRGPATTADKVERYDTEVKNIAKINQELKRTDLPEEERKALVDAKKRHQSNIATAKKEYTAFVEQFSNEDQNEVINIMNKIGDLDDKYKKTKSDVLREQLTQEASNLLARKEAIEKKYEGVKAAPATEPAVQPTVEPVAVEPVVSKSEQDVIDEQIMSLNDDEPVTFTVEDINEIPEPFRDRAVKVEFGTIKVKKKILGLPIGKESEVEVPAKYRYTLTGKEAKDYAVQKQTTDEGVLRAEEPQVGLQEVGQGDQEPQVATQEVEAEEVVTTPAVETPVVETPATPAQTAKAEKIAAEAEGEVEVYNQKIERLQEEIEIERGNLKEELDDINAKIKDVRASKLSAAEKRELIEDLKAQAQDVKDDINGTIGAYKEEIAALKSDIKKAQKKAEKARATPAPKAKPVAKAAKVTEKPLAPVAPDTTAAEPAAEPATPAPTAAEEFERKKRELLLKSGIDPAILSRRRESADAPAGIERLQSLADNALAAVAKVMPKLKIVVHDNSFKFGKAVGASRITNHGIYDPATKTIHINGPIASASTIAHEVFHAIFLEKVKTDATAQVAAKRMVEAIKNIVGEDTELYAYLEDFSSNYDDNFKDEEKLAELVGVLADYYAGSDISGLPYEQSQSFKKAVIRFIRDIARAFNIKLPTNITDTDVLAVLDTIARKATEGKKISKSDIDVLSALAESSQEVVAATRERRGLITMTDKDALKFAKAGVQDMRVAQAATDIGLDKMKFDEASIKQQIDDELDSLYDDAKIGMYNGEPIILTEDSQAITGIILGEIKALEEQGAPLSEVESARASIDNPTFRRRYLKQYQAAQELTISQWVYALRKSDFSSAFNYLMLDAVLSHNYDFNLNKYFKRNSKTVRNITPYDPGTLAELYASDNSKELLIDYVKIQVKNMGNIVKANKFKTDSDGTWVKFNGGNTQTREDIDANASALSQLVQNTYWCTKTNANSQLSGGDFYVYVTESSSGEFEPKIAIRMNGSSIGEVRGNASQAQDIEPAMLEKAEAFLINDIPGTDGDKWVNSMRFNKKVESLSKSIAGRPLSKEDYMEYISIKADASKYSIDRSENGYVQTLSNIVDEKVKNNDLVDRFIVTDPADIIPGVTIALIGSYETRVLDKGVDMSGIEFIYGDLDVDSDWSDLKNIKSISGNLSIASPSVKTLGNLESAGAVDFFSAGIESLGNLRSTNMAINFDFVSKFDTPWFRDLSDFGKLEEIGQGSWKTISIPPKIKTINGPTKINGVVRVQDTANDHVVSLGTVKEINGELIVGSGLESLGDLEIVSDNVTIDISAKIDSLGKLKQADGIRVFGPNVKSISGLNKAPSIVAGPDVEVIDLNGTDISSLEMRGSSDIKNIDYINELIIETLLNEKDNSQLTISTPSPGSLKFVNKLSVYTGKSGFNFGNLLSVSFLNVKTSGKVSAGKNGVKVNVIGSFKSEDNILPGVKSINDLHSTGISSIPDLKFAGEPFFEQAVKKGFNNSSDEYASILNRYISNQRLSGTPALQDIINAAVSTLNGVIKEKENLDKQNAPAIRERKATPVSMTAQESTEFDDLLRVEGGEKQTTIKPLAVREKKMTDQEIRDNLDRRAKKLFPSDADVFTPDDFRVFFLDDNFKPIKGMENVSKMYQKIAENDGVYMLFGMGLRGGFMFTDQARGGEEIDIEFELDKVSPYTGTGSPDSVYISAIQVLSQEGQSKGAGTRLMNRIIEAADELGIPLELEAYPTKKFQRGERGEFSETTKQKMSKRLVEFYKKFGFTPIAKTGPDANMMIRQPQPLVRERKAGERRSLEQIKAENAAKREESRNKRMLERKELMEKARERFDTAAQKAKEEKEQAKQAEETLNNAIDEYVNAIINADNAKDINAKLENLRTVAGTLNKTIFAKQMRKIAATLKKKGAISDVSVTTLNRILRTIERVGDENYQQEVERALNALKQEINSKLRRELNGLRKKALKNIQGGAIGTSGLKPLFQRLLSVDAKMIPDQHMDDYIAMVRRLGAAQRVLPLDSKQKFSDAANEILDTLDAESGRLIELSSDYRAYLSANPAMREEGYAKVADAMLKDGIISEKDRELMRRYKDIITAEAKKAGYTKASSETEKALEEREALLAEIDSIKVNLSGIDTRESRDIAKELLDNLDAAEELTNQDLRQLVRVLDNLVNGFLPHQAEIMRMKLRAIKDGATLTKAVEKAKVTGYEKLIANVKGLVLRLFGSSSTETTASVLAARRNPAAYIDQVFGNFKSTPIYDTLIRPLASAVSSFQRDYDVAVNTMNEAEERLLNAFKRDGNAVRASMYKIQMYLLQREYNSNQGNPEVSPAVDWINATLDAIDSEAIYNAATGDELRDILNKYSVDGQVSTELIEKSLTPAEKNFIAAVDKVNASTRDMAVHVSDVIRGEGIKARDNYVHIQVIEGGKDSGKAIRDEISNILNRFSPSTKAKSLITRTGRVSPINLDPYATTLRGARMTMLDYHLTQPLKQTNATMNVVKNSVSGEARKTYTALKSVMSGLTENFLANTTTSNSAIENYLTRAGYRAMLGSVTRSASELASNTVHAIIAPSSFLEGGKVYASLKNEVSAGDVLKNVGSTQSQRLFGGETLTNKEVETSALRNGGGMRIEMQSSDIINKAQAVLKMVNKNTEGVASKVADFLISSPDKFVSKRIWFGKFNEAFKDSAGVAPDMQKLASNDEQYLRENSDAIKKATRAADNEVVRAAASSNPYDAILKMQTRPDDGALRKVVSSINGFMSRFIIYEFATARAAIYAMMGQGELSRTEGARLLTAVGARAVSYTMLASYLSSAMATVVLNGLAAIGLVDWPEEEIDEAILPDEDTPERLLRAVGGAVANLFVNRNFGNVVKNITSYGIEYLNKEYLDVLRNGGEYDPYENNLVISQLPTQLEGNKSIAESVIAAYSGAFSPIVRTGFRAGTLVKQMSQAQSYATREKNKKELMTRIPLEVAGSLGYIPVYKDMRNIALENMFGEKSGAKNKADFEAMMKEARESLRSPEVRAAIEEAKAAAREAKKTK